MFFFFRTRIIRWDILAGQKIKILAGFSLAFGFRDEISVRRNERNDDDDGLSKVPVSRRGGRRKPIINVS